MPAAGPWPETQEEILAAALAARDERDVPAEDDSWVIVDSDGDRPAELAGLDGAELDELLTAAPSGPGGAAPGSGPGGGAGFAEGGVLDVLAPGVALAGCAEDAHARLGELTDDELIGVLRAWGRQESWAQARKLAAVAELARRRPADRTPTAPSGRFPEALSEFTADEVALALTLTRRSAGMQLDLALAMAARPAIAALLEAGEIDLLRVRVIIDGIAGLAAGHAAAVEAAVLPEAPGMTSGQLRAAVAQAVQAADPDAARRQREEDVKDARVECWADPAGTANLAGRSLPCAETLAADQRLGQIARAWKKQLAAAWKQVSPVRPEHRPATGVDLLAPAPTWPCCSASRSAPRPPTSCPAARLAPPAVRPVPTHIAVPVHLSVPVFLPVPAHPSVPVFLPAPAHPSVPALRPARPLIQAPASPSRPAPAVPATARPARPPPECLPRISRRACAGPSPRPAARCRRWPGRCS